MLIPISTAFINAVKRNDKTEVVRLRNLLENQSLNAAHKELMSDREKMVFWVNIYNAFFQVLATEKRDFFVGNWSRFFQVRQVNILGQKMSLDDIEHVILRRSKLKFGLGFVQHPFQRGWKRKLRVKLPDYRIHFVLNCGAESCPVIQPLSIENIAEELEWSTKEYFKREIKVIPQLRRIEINELFLFYLGDFGGRKGLKKILIDYAIITPEQSRFKWKFTKFDKNLKLANFRS